MQGEEFVITLVAIIFGTVLTGYIFGKIIGLIKSWTNRNSSPIDEEKFDRLAKSFIKHKKEMERRVQNIEAIVTDKESATNTESRRRLNESNHETIEIDAEDSENKQKEKSDNGHLNNMLKNKQGLNNG